ncbi:hypothetical protein [Leptolyngbya iicbica]|uniref:Uncharacterized protein n=2 Tax=Cyanophyceae TaxID=3028117 RepID=A0A4Q7EFJ3_9CYAN|nr:hypothetical protein [Leptolyngbya sp. LK]RZM82624.1 hypothetical protein DYY88_05170 [Leptolyngbya sp. LK]
MSAVLSVLLFLGFYGNLQISFFLYKILQGATLAMIVYLEVIPIVYELLQASKFKRYFTHQRLLDISFLVTALWICRDCHQEKVLYIFAIVLSYTFLSIVKAIAERERPIMLSIVVFSLTLVPLLVITLTKAAPKSVDPFLVKQWFAIGNYALFSYWPTAPNSGVLLLDMVVIGLAIIVLSCYKQASKEFFMAAIAIAAFLLFLNPIFATALLKFTHGINIYRVMIAGLPWTFLPLACHALKRDKFINLHYLPIVFICFGFLAYSPMYGKFSHMLTAVPPYADGRDLMPIVQHLLAEADHANQPPLNVMAPPYAGSYLAAWPNLKSAASNRWIDNRIFSARAELSYLYGSEITDSEITEKLTSGNYDVIILDRRDGLTYQSWLGRMTQHWAPDLIASQQALLAGQSLRRYLENQPQPVFEKTLEQDGFEVYQRRAG